MDVSKLKLKQACRKNQYRLAITFMEGDADGYKTGLVYSDKYEGEIEELMKLYREQIKVASRGLGGDDCDELLDDTAKKFANNPVLVAAVAKKFNISEEEQKDLKAMTDAARDYLLDLGHCNYGGYDIPRAPDSLELTYFDSNGDEYYAEKVGRWS
jgi:hypothetical protein